MLGNMCIIDEVGYYEQAEKIVNMPLGIITALGTVMLPRISNLVSKGEFDKIFKLIKKSISFIMFLAFPICFGLMAISSDFVPIFLGEKFSKSGELIYYLAPTLLFISFANVLRTQYLIPKEQDKIYVSSVICGALINLVINFVLIPKYQSVGACIGTISAELFVMLYQMIALRKELPILNYLKDIFVFFVRASIMCVIVLLIGLVNINVLVKIILQILFGGIIYAILNYKYITQIIDFKKVLMKVKI